VKRQIKIFLADGSPSGLRIVELGLSTVKAASAPRTKRAALAARPEARRTGIDVLTLEGPCTARTGKRCCHRSEVVTGS
jgi:hypothetical protein